MCHSLLLSLLDGDIPSAGDLDSFTAYRSVRLAVKKKPKDFFPIVMLFSHVQAVSVPVVALWLSPYYPCTEGSKMVMAEIW